MRIAPTAESTHMKGHERLQKPQTSLPEPQQALVGKKVLIVSSGTRGDIQPYAALARGLNAAGFKAIVFTNPEFRKMVTDLGLEFYSNGAVYKDFIAGPQCQKAFEANNFLKLIDAVGKHNAKWGSSIYELLYKCLQETKPFLVISGSSHWMDACWIPILFRIPAFPVNLSNSHTIDPYKAPFGLPTLPCGMNRQIWMAVWNAYIGDCKKAYGNTLAKLSGKPLDDFFPSPDDFASILGSGPKFSFVPYVIAQDDNMIGRKPIDPPNLVYTGSYALPPDECKGSDFGGSQNAELDAFLQQCGEDRPVYIGWGSLKGTDSDWLTRYAVKALKIVGCKGIILRGYAELKEELLKGDQDEAALVEYSRKNILWMDSAAHEVLFPQCSVIVHHGGIGTTQVGLRSGRPSIITPVVYDQFDSAEMVEARKVGFRTMQLPKTQPEDLAELIKECLSDKDIQERALDLANQLNSRNGIKEFVQLTLNFIKDEVDSGKYMESFDKIAEEKQQENKKCCCCKSKPRRWTTEEIAKYKQERGTSSLFD